MKKNTQTTGLKIKILPVSICFLILVVLFSCVYLVLNTLGTAQADIELAAKSAVNQKVDEVSRFLRFKCDTIAQAALAQSEVIYEDFAAQEFIESLTVYYEDGTKEEFGDGSDAQTDMLAQSGGLCSGQYRAGGKDVVAIYTGIGKSGIKGAAVTMTGTSVLLHSGVSFFQDGAGSCIADENGNVFIGMMDEAMPENSVFEVMNAYGMSASVADLNGTLAYDNSSRVFINGATMACIGVQQISQTQWYLVYNMNGDVLQQQRSAIMSRTIFVALMIMVVFSGALLFCYFFYKRLIKKTAEEADYDRLLNIPSYTKFVTELPNIIQNDFTTDYAVIYFDIDNFKYLNNVYGNAVCDDLLRHTVKAARTTGRRNEMIGRFSSDHFLLLTSYENFEMIGKRIESLSKAIAGFEPIAGRNGVIRITAGVYCVERGMQYSGAEMVNNAVIALKSIKRGRKVNYALYDNELRDSYNRVSELETGMENALDKNEFVLFFQPKYNLKNRCVDGAEVLSRWNNSKYGDVSPVEYISLFENSGAIAAFDNYILEQSCRTIRRWVDQGRKVVPLAVNVSRVSINRLDFVSRCREIKKKYRIADNFIELEFTESANMTDYVKLSKTVSELKQCGFRCTIDDFGEGYSTLRAIQELDIDVLKLDKFFLKTIDQERNRKLLEGVVALASSLNIKTVMEGVEEEKDIELLRSVGCDAIQGYFYSMPIPEDKFLTFVENAEKITF